MNTAPTDQELPATRPVRVARPVRRPTWRPDGVRRAGRRRRRADLLEASGLGIVLAPALLFLAHGGGRALIGAGWGDLMLGLGRLTGLEAVAVLLLQMLLAARVPWIDRTYGHDRALVAHRLLARVSLPLLIAHVLTLLVGYASMNGLGARLGWLRESFRMLGGEVPDMLTAFLSFAAILLVAVTSVRLARRRVRHETWHLVHLTAYAGIALSVPHQLSAGTDIAGHPWAQAFWLGLYLATAGTAVSFRVIRPVWFSLRHRLVVTEVRRESAGAVTVVVSGRGLDRFPARAGQFLQWRFLAPGLWASAHPWSLSAAPDGRTLRITVKDLGDHSRRLRTLRPGVRVVVEGPYGRFTTERRTRQRVLLLAAGIGITPIRALLDELVSDDLTRAGDVTLLYRAADEGSLVLADEITWLAANHGVRVMFLLGAGEPGSWLPRRLGAGRSGDDATALGQLVPGLAEHDVYQCGPPPWMDLVRRTLRSAGVPANQIHDERFAW